MNRKGPERDALTDERERLKKMARYVTPSFRTRKRNVKAGYEFIFSESTGAITFVKELTNPIELKQKCLPWSPHLSILLLGVQDNKSPLFLLRGHTSTIIREIYEHLVAIWCNNIEITVPAFMIGKNALNDNENIGGKDREVVRHRGRTLTVEHILVPKTLNKFSLGISNINRPRAAFAICNEVYFPKPKGININMMPFIMGIRSSLPDFVQQYYEHVIQKCPIRPQEVGQVGFLTIQESFVHAENTQRRGGIHTEALSAGIGGIFSAGWEHHWGCGVFYGEDEYQGGLYMASNMNDTCKVWNALVNLKEGIVNYDGGADHLRPFIGTGQLLKANQLIWLTDRTPHEALPQKSDGYRQFFRLVTSNVSLWFAEHSTPNPKVVLPPNIRVIQGNKFANTKC